MTPFWSVIVPVRAPAPYLAECLTSVPRSADIEILVQINPLGDHDGPTDDVVSNPALIGTAPAINCKDIGLYASINAALGRARGKWIHVCHADDYVLPGFYAKMRVIVESDPDIQMAACRARILTPQGMGLGGNLLGIGPSVLLAKVDMKGALDECNPFTPVQVVINRDVFALSGQFREDLQFAGDWEFYRRARALWAYTPEPLAVYRIHDGQETDRLIASGRARAEWEFVKGAGDIAPVEKVRFKTSV